MNQLPELPMVMTEHERLKLLSHRRITHTGRIAKALSWLRSSNTTYIVSGLASLSIILAGIFGYLSTQYILLAVVVGNVLSVVYFVLAIYQAVMLWLHKRKYNNLYR